MIMEVISEIEFNGDESYYLDFKNLAQSLIKGQGLSGYKVIGMVKVTYGWVRLVIISMEYILAQMCYHMV